MIKFINGKEVYSVRSIVTFRCGLCDLPLHIKPSFRNLRNGVFQVEGDDNIDCFFTRKVFTENIDLDADPEQMALYEKHLSSWYMELT